MRDVHIFSSSLFPFLVSLQELQQRLTAAETGHGHSSRSPEKIGSVESSIKRGEREKELEKQVKSKSLPIRVYDMALYTATEGQERQGQGPEADHPRHWKGNTRN